MPSEMVLLQKGICAMRGGAYLQKTWRFSCAKTLITANFTHILHIFLLDLALIEMDFVVFLTNCETERVNVALHCLPRRGLHENTI